jgi:hypothetical protein
MSHMDSNHHLLYFRCELHLPNFISSWGSLRKWSVLLAYIGERRFERSEPRGLGVPPPTNAQTKALTDIRVLVDSDANISTIAKLHDHISNTLSTVLGKWVFEYKLFRENLASSSKGSSDKTSFLYTFSFSHHPGAQFCLTNGSGTVLEGDFDTMLVTKLQSLWTQRQVIRGEGHSYELNGGDFILRLANMFLQGGYKGLLVEVEYTKQDVASDPSATIRKINEFLKQYDLEYKGTKLGKSRIETAWQYVDALQGRYVG